MKRTIAVAFVLLFSSVSAFAELRGSWTASIDDNKPGRVHMNLSRRQNHNFGNTMNVADFTGLSDAVMRSGVQTPVNFQLKREAGTISFDGTFRSGDGAGQWTFVASDGFADRVRAMGIEFDLHKHGRLRENTEEEELFSLAVLDVSTAFIRSMQAEGYKVTLDKYLEMRIFNVNPDYIGEMRSLGYKDITARELINSRIHGVTPDYIRKMRAAGWGDLSLQELQNSRIHGATPEFAAEMKTLGYGNLDHQDLINFRIHGVSAEFIRDLRELGYDNVRADDLVAMRIHGVSAKFIRELADAGYKNIPVRKLIDMRIHNIDVKFIKKMNDVD